MQGVNRTLMAVSFLSFSALSFNGFAQQQDQTVEEAETDPKTQACLMQKLNEAEGDALVAQLRQECEVEVDTELRDRNNREAGAISKRFLREKETNFDPYVITPHKMNYILPISYTDSINRKEYAESVPSSNWAENLEDYEAKYQLSIKVPLNYGDLLFENDSLYFGMTLQSWWQVYSENISKPFRETNYQPEIFYLTGLDWHPFDGNTGIMFGAEHQSNGRSNAISRSWNRIYTSLLWENGDLAFAGRVWYRLEEDEKDFPGDSDGDDNPDINDFMGYGSISMAYQYDVVEFAVNVRHNFATHKGGVEAGMTFPLWGKLKGYVQYTGGYGESLIDYDHKQNRIGIGLALTEVL
ncbi:phospholipase [Thalassotalea sp. HSM 43]|uniref:phospholipase A n=1 Tax=Thalassotalea sp. HSM 43 TaxID=2552945 RepID=UPI0010815637|nr:phospholipase A [Thalassotalea sp. HSM 43]QBY05471.1 phospholipase [Thalassotalea sp. HSM 43]